MDSKPKQGLIGLSLFLFAPIESNSQAHSARGEQPTLTTPLGPQKSLNCRFKNDLCDAHARPNESSSRFLKR